MNANAEDPGTAIDGHPVTCGSTKRRTRAPRPTERLKGGMSGFDKSSDLALRALAAWQPLLSGRYFDSPPASCRPTWGGRANRIRTRSGETSSPKTPRGSRTSPGEISTKCAPSARPARLTRTTT